MTMYHDPIVWNVGRQLLGEVINAYLADSTFEGRCDRSGSVC